MAYRPPLPIAAATVAARRRRGLLLLACAAAVALAGCQEETIQHYTVFSDDALAEPVAPQRVVVAYVYQGGDLWVFKLLGPKDAVEKHLEEFKKFLGSVSFSVFPQAGVWGLPRNWVGDDPVWSELPAGWKQVESKEPMRYATLQVGSEDPPLECVVSTVPARPDETGKFDRLRFSAMNVSRWRGQVGLRSVDPHQLIDLIKEVSIGPERIPASLVDMVGPGKVARGGDTPPMMGMGQRRDPHAGMPQQAKLDRILAVWVEKGEYVFVFYMGGPAELIESQKDAFDAFLQSVKFTGGQTLTFRDPPANWKPTQGKIKEVVYAFNISEGGRTGRVTVSAYPPGWDAAANVKRWRGIVGLPPETPDQTARSVRPYPVGGVEGQSIDLNRAGGAAP
jgi:hypothetical protein